MTRMTFKELSLKQILERIPRKLVVRFTLDCAYDVKDYIKDPRSIKALEITELWLIDKATNEELRVAAYAAANAAYTAAYASYAANAANATVYAINAADATYTAYASYAAACAATDASKITKKDYTQILLNSLSELERLMWNL
jgi:hypothetical protein